MKFINQLLVCLALFLLITPVLTFAQNNENSTSDITPGTVLAEINISNAAMEQTESIARVSFEVENLGSKPQVGIIYGIELVKASEEAPSLVDVMVVPEERAVPATGAITTSLEYDGSHLPAGTYEVWAMAKTSGGLVLGIAKLQDYVSTNNKSLEIKADTCLLKVANETYYIEQGIDVSPTEEVIISCEVKNGSSEQINFKPNFVNHERTVYGDEVDMSYPEQTFMMLEAGKSKTFDFELPKAARSQAYDAVLSLIAEDGKLISNSAFVHYVVQGESGTVQNITFDKTQYKAGENINLDILWSIAADNFPESRSGGTGQSEDYFINLTVTSADERVCSEGQYPVGSSDHTKVSLLSGIDCINPTAKVGLVTASGAVLDTESVTVVTSEAVPVEESVESTGSPLSKNIYLTIALFAAIGVVLLLWYGRKHHNHIVADSIKGLVLALVLGAGFLGNVGSAEAVTWSLDGQISGGNNCLVNGVFAPCPPRDITILTATVNLNRTTFAPGETATLSGSIQNHVCSNLYYELNANFDGDDIALFRGRNRGVSSVSNTFTVPTTPGRYTVNLGMCYTNISNCASQSLTFTVANPAVAGRCQASHYRCSAGTSPRNTQNETSTRYTWSCNGTNGGSNASCSENKVNGSCGSTQNSCAAGNAAAGGSNATHYTWNCNSTNGGSSASCSMPIPPTVDLNANPTLVGLNRDSTLTWTPTHSSACVASSNPPDPLWTGSKAATGVNNTGVVRPGSPTVYTLTCTGLNGATVSDSVNVAVPSGTLTASACPAPIPLGGSSCNSTVNWSANNFLGTTPSPSITQNGVQFSSAQRGPVTRPINPDDRTFQLIDTHPDSGFILTAQAPVSCANGGVWAGGTCMQLPIITVISNPDIVRRGDTAPVTVTVTSPTDLSCVMAGAVSQTFTHTGGGAPVTYTYTSEPLHSARIVEVTCTSPTYPAVSGTASARIEVIPTIEEI